MGTPVPPGFPNLGGGRATWTVGAALVPGVRGVYRVRGPLGVSARAAVVQHVFTDDLFGSTGTLLSLGATRAW